jgi:hypothetical protein
MIDDVIVQNCGETLSYWIVLNVYGEFQYHLSGDPPPGMTMQTDGGKLTFNDACPGNHDYSVEVNAENGSASAPAEVIRFHVN